jgi:hypothetical protein
MEAIQARYAKAERQFLNLAGVDADGSNDNDF